MPKSIIAEGKTTTEAVSNGLKELKVSKDMVDIKVLENTEKRSFFSILTPRVVKVELTIKENVKENRRVETREMPRNHREEAQHVPADEKDLLKAKEQIEIFLKELLSKFEDIQYSIDINEEFIEVDLKGEEASKLIGYRGEVLNSLQIILGSVANKELKSKVKILLNAGEFREKRKIALEELAEKIAKTVTKTGKSITLEPMMAYERKVIHTKLQDSKTVRTYSTGEDPYRKVIITKINK